jgi:hypothetical protein
MPFIVSSDSSSETRSSTRTATPWWRRRPTQRQTGHTNVSKHLSHSSSSNSSGLWRARSLHFPKLTSSPWWGIAWGTDPESLQAQQALVRARKAAAALRWRVSGPPLLLGLLMLAVVACGYFAQVGGGPRPVRRSMYGLFMFSAVICLGLAVLPTDEALIRTLALLACPVFLAVSFHNLRVALANATGPDAASCGIPTAPEICTLDWLVASLIYACCAVALLPAVQLTPRVLGYASTESAMRIRSYFRMAPRAALARLWLVARVMCISIGSLNLFHCSVHVAVEPEYLTGCVEAASDGECNVADAGAFAQDMLASLVILLCGLVPTHAMRLGVQSYLASRVREGEARQAAIVAHLMGKHGSRRAFESGVASFRGLPFSSICSDDLTTSRDTGLFGRTVKCKLGGVDAFISHSWHDSGPAKWALLTRWAHQFELAHGRQPVVWLDKGCIDQQVGDEQERRGEGILCCRLRSLSWMNGLAMLAR